MRDQAMYFDSENDTCCKVCFYNHANWYFFFKGWGGHKQFRYEMYLQPLDVVWRRLSGASKWCWFVKVFRELRSPNESGKFLVLAILQATLLLYLVAIVFARREDRKDRAKVSWMNYSDTWTTCWDVALCSEFYMHVFSIGFVEKLPKMFL